MKKLVYFQLMVLAVSGVITFLLYGKQHAISLMLGGLVYAVPTFISVSILLALKKFPDMLPQSLIMIEGSKVLMVIILMLLSYLLYGDINWMAFLVGLILVSQTGLFIFRKNSYYE